MPATDCIIIMARYPSAGTTKTRLIPALGAVKAAALHEHLVRHTLQTMQRFQKTQPCELRVHFAGGDAASMHSLFGPGFSCFPQFGESLGDRIVHAVNAAFLEGMRRVVVIGTDCPALTELHMQQAFDNLVGNVIALGPACDGGYYLVGMSACRPELFSDISWGTDCVYQQTVAKAKQAGLTVKAMPVLSDIDHPEDLIQCRKANDGVVGILPSISPSLLSVIIPTLNEESMIGSLLEHLKRLDGIEVIVADGGSVDRTREVATAAGATVVMCNKGRGRQMNAGAAMASGDVFLFVHADAILPEEFNKTVRDILSDPGNAGGAFRLSLKDNQRLLRLVEFGANLRSRWFQLPYGDQAIFVRAATFFQMDGFRNWPLMEDYDFCQRLRSQGRIQLASQEIQVSARRWKQLGIIRTTLINQLCVVGFRLGVSPETLHRLYVRTRKSMSRTSPQRPG